MNELRHSWLERAGVFYRLCDPSDASGSLVAREDVTCPDCLGLLDVQDQGEKFAGELAEIILTEGTVLKHDPVTCGTCKLGRQLRALEEFRRREGP